MERNRTIDIFLTRFSSLDEDPFFKEVYLYLKDEILEQGCILGEILNYLDIISLTEKSVSKVPFKSFDEVLSIKRKQPLSTIEHKKDSGLIILGKCPTELIQTLKKRYSYIVGIDRNPTNFEYDEVICNGMSAAEMADCLVFRHIEIEISFHTTAMNMRRHCVPYRAWCKFGHSHL